MSFLKIQNKLINKSEIAYITYDTDNTEFDIHIITIHKDNFYIVANSEEERTELLDIIEGQCYFGYDCDLFEIAKGTYINLKVVTSIQFVQDTLNKEEVWIAQINWSKINILPETVILDKEYYKTQDEIDELLEQIHERD